MIRTKLSLQNRLLSQRPSAWDVKEVTNAFPKAYVPSEVEAGWYDWWQKEELFSGNENSSEIFSMVLPPPNVTGTLHLGHALTCAIQDSIARWHRMQGKQVVWVPGCDHAGIATQVVVEKYLSKEFQQSRHDLGREAFVAKIWEWKESKGGKIFEQLKKMGASLDWNKSVFTMDQRFSRSVTEAFIRLHKEGYIYREKGLVNWSCQLQSAISDIEVDHKPVAGPTLLSVPAYEQPVKFGTLTYFAYKVCNSDEEVVVSTTRPETMLGDVAVAVHPSDSRYSSLINRHVWHPIRKIALPIVADEAVDPEFGTGAVKITPAHDPNDFAMSKRHPIEVVSILDEKGMMNEKCGPFAGLPRFTAREKVLQYLTEQNLLKKIEAHNMTIPLCSRSGDVIEPLLKPQWFLDCKEAANQAIRAVETGQLRIQPQSYEKNWFDWLSNIRPWCISRQLWWGHRVPAYFCQTPVGRSAWISALGEEDARKRASQQMGVSTDALVSVVQDEDVLDTWFSSGLFPFACFGWPESTPELAKFFPLNLLETGHDILFFWVGRMVMLSLMLNQKLPFQEVLLHGIICDSQGRKMSKSLGNVIDPMDVISGVSFKALEKEITEKFQSGYLSAEERTRAINDKKREFPEGIPECGADALRFALCSYNLKNNFINLDVNHIKKYRLFCNKIWQASKFCFLSLEKLPTCQKDGAKLSLEKRSLMEKWILSRFAHMVENIDASYRTYDLHVVVSALYSFFYDEFCDVFLEACKPSMNSASVDANMGTSLVLIGVLDAYYRMLAPMMPYLAEELYQRLHAKLANMGVSFELVAPQSKSVTVAPYPHPEQWKSFRNVELEHGIALALDIVKEIRAVKTLYNLKAKPLCFVECEEPDTADVLKNLSPVISHLAQTASEVAIYRKIENEADQGERRCVVRPLSNKRVLYVNLKGVLDFKVELEKSTQKETKLQKELHKLKTATGQDGFLRAPPHVQKSLKEKVSSIEAELKRLDDYKRMLSGMNDI